MYLSKEPEEAIPRAAHGRARCNRVSLKSSQLEPNSAGSVVNSASVANQLSTRWNPVPLAGYRLVPPIKGTISGMNNPNPSTG